MPPWSADPQKSLKFRNVARLTALQIATLTAWVDSGAQGSGALTPPAIQSQGRAPDLVISMDHDLQIPATGDIPYLKLLVKLPEMEDRWISAVEARPGNASVVHHMAITEVGLDEGVSPNDLEGFAMLARRMGTALASPMHPVVPTPRGELFDMIGIYTPGAALETYGPTAASCSRAVRTSTSTSTSTTRSTGSPPSTARKWRSGSGPRRPWNSCSAWRGTVDRCHRGQGRRNASGASAHSARRRQLRGYRHHRLRARRHYLSINCIRTRICAPRIFNMSPCILTGANRPCSACPNTTSAGNLPMSWKRL